MSVRYAPSPTGSLHVGNLRTAWVSHRLAKAVGLDWVVRFENIDTPRNIPGCIEEQTKDLAKLDLIPDRTAIQSEQRPRHLELFSRALAQGKIYPCDCSRKEVGLALQNIASAPHAVVPSYSGRCRDRTDFDPAITKASVLGWRFRCEDRTGAEDFIVARTAPTLDSEEIQRTFLPSYDWACAIDDVDGRHTLLVRAIDLQPALRRQSTVWRWLAERGELQGPVPAVFHTSLLLRADGSRIEKRNRGVLLKELEERFGVPEILRRFEESFRTAVPKLVPGGSYREPYETLTLAELNLDY